MITWQAPVCIMPRDIAHSEPYELIIITNYSLLISYFSFLITN